MNPEPVVHGSAQDSLSPIDFGGLVFGWLQADYRKNVILIIGQLPGSNDRE